MDYMQTHELEWYLAPFMSFLHSVLCQRQMLKIGFHGPKKYRKGSFITIINFLLENMGHMHDIQVDFIDFNQGFLMYLLDLLLCTGVGSVEARARARGPI